MASFGKSFFFNDIWETSHTLHLYTGALGSIGFGAVFGCHRLHGIWPEMWKTFNIAFLELSPIVLAVHVWGSLMANNRIIFFSDNAAVVDFVNKQTSRHKDIMVLLRDLVLSCLRHNILFQARHIPGFQDSSADYLSQVVNFRHLLRSRRISHSDTREPNAENLGANLRTLLSSSLTAGSRRSYQRAWITFRQFYLQFYASDDPLVPVPTTCLHLFISYLTSRKSALSTVTSYLSAISYVHKLRGLHDPTKSFSNSKAINGSQPSTAS